MLDIHHNRKTVKYTRKELILRVLWSFVSLLFRCSPRLCWGWRRALLRCFGAKIGKGVQIFPTVRIFAPWNLTVGEQSSMGFDVLVYNLGEIRIGKRVTVSQRVHLCAGTHDPEDPGMMLLKPPILIEDDAWICADAFVGPDVVVNQGAVVGARSVVVKHVEPFSIVVGNPAREIRKRSLRE